MPACRSWKNQTLQLVGLETLKHEVAVKFTQNYIYICRSLQHMYIYIYCVYIYVEVQSQRKQQNLSIEWLLKQKNLTINDRAIYNNQKKSDNSKKKRHLHQKTMIFIHFLCFIQKSMEPKKFQFRAPNSGWNPGANPLGSVPSCFLEPKMAVVETRETAGEALFELFRNQKITNPKRRGRMEVVEVGYVFTSNLSYISIPSYDSRNTRLTFES